MFKEYTIRETIEYGMNNLSLAPYNKERFNEATKVFEKKGYESLESIDAFLECLSQEQNERMFWGPDMIYYYIMLTPKCKERFVGNIYLYSPLVNSFINFLQEFELKRDLEYVSKIIIEKRKEYPKSFSMYVSANWKNAALRYCEVVDSFPDAKTFEKVERDCKRKYNCSVGMYWLSECLNLIKDTETLTKAEIDFWNENLKLMKKWLTQTEYKAFLSKRYMLMYEQIKIFNRDVQEEILIRFGQRSISRFVSKGNTEDIAYLLIGKALNKGGVNDLYKLIDANPNQKKFTDWNGLVKIFEKAYEEVEPSNLVIKSRFESLLNISKDMLNEGEEMDPDDVLGNLMRALDF